MGFERNSDLWRKEVGLRLLKRWFWDRNGEAVKFVESCISFY